MGNRCNGECRELRGRTEEMTKRIDDLHRQVEAAAVRSDQLRAQMEKQMDQMRSAKDAHIGDLKAELEKNRAERARVEEEKSMLQNKMIEIQREHAAQLIKSQEIMAAMVKDMNESNRLMVQNMFEEFRAMMKMSEERNERQFNSLMNHMDRQDKRIGDILERMDKRIDALERARAKKDGLDLDTTDYSGAHLYALVDEQRREIDSRGMFVPKGHFVETTPIAAAAFAAFDAIAMVTAGGAIA